MGILKKKLLIAASIFAAIICTTSLQCYGNTSDYDEEMVYSDSFHGLVTVPDDISWKEKNIVRKVENGRKVKYVLNDKKVKIYIDKELIWQSDDSVFVQDMIIDDINEDNGHKDEVAESKRSKDEIILLMWKKGRYGINRPFWVKEDETDYSQHLFVYNISGNKLIQRWGSSYMGFEASNMDFVDGILYLTDKNGDNIPWVWSSFGFYRVNDTRLVIAGDNLMHKEIYQDAIANHGGKFEYIYKKMKPYLRDADFSIINLETPLVKDPSRYSTYPCFGGPVEIAEAIKNTGFDGVTLATNHRFDKGASGVTETIEALDENELIHVGSMDDEPYVIVIRNRIKFALLNYTYGTNGIKPPKGIVNGVNYLEDENKIREDIRKARKNADFVIVFPHWGTEYRKEPDAMQKKWTDVFYEEGVDAVVGTHPHVIEPYEMYSKGERNMLVYYSLGNYISSNQRRDHNGGGIAIFDVRKTPEGTFVTDYDFVEIDSIFNASKYK